MEPAPDAAPPRHRARGVGIAIVGLVLLGAVLAAVVIGTGGRPGAASDNPFSNRDLYVYPLSTAAEAAADAEGTDASAPFSLLAATPTAVWLLPEEYPGSAVTEFVSGVGADAAAQEQLPVFVVYGIPSRDCGNFSAGGSASGQEYSLWVSAIATGLAGRDAVIILEPDALALSTGCGTQDATAQLLADAITRLSANPATTIYLDGGHSHWMSADEMAPLLLAAGVDRVRGFATNVSNYNTTSDEREYGQALSELLGGAHFVVDVSRNGNGPSGEWCNPAGRAIGATPSGVDDGTPQDASLWIKNPGESDGECNGGPPAGQWWPDQALALVNASN